MLNKHERCKPSLEHFYFCAHKATTNKNIQNINNNNKKSSSSTNNECGGQRQRTVNIRRLLATKQKTKHCTSCSTANTKRHTKLPSPLGAKELAYGPVGLGVSFIMSLCTFAGVKLYILSQSSRFCLCERCRPDTALLMALVYSRTPKLVWGSNRPTFSDFFCSPRGPWRDLSAPAHANRPRKARATGTLPIVTGSQGRTRRLCTLSAS